MTLAWMLALQVLTALPKTSPGGGLPKEWKIHRPRTAPAPRFSVTGDRAVRVETYGAAGFAMFTLTEPILPSRRGVIAWRWMTPMGMRYADLRSRTSADSPVRLLVAFKDGRTLSYSWGNKEPVGDTFPSSTDSNQMVIVVRRTDEATGIWRQDRRDPFADYRRAFRRPPPAIVAVGVGADSDGLAVQTRAEIADIAWRESTAPPGQPER